MLIILARLEGKLDVVAAQHDARLSELTRRVDAAERQRQADDARLRTIEARPTVTPRAMWTGVGTVGALVVGAVTIAEKLLAG